MVKLDDETEKDHFPTFTLSKTEKNVVVIMLDRAMGEYVPYIFNEKPELVEKYDGFTFYPNTLSFAGYTKMATPALFGGYEYTPAEINKRDGEPLSSKHSEALMVMPAIFGNAGYDVSFFNPPYLNYRKIMEQADLDGIPNIKASSINGFFMSEESMLKIFNNRERNFFCFGLTRIAPVFLQRALYQEGNYHQLVGTYNVQVLTSLSTAFGLSADFESNILSLEAMPDMTKLVDNEGSLLLLASDVTHSACFLSEPDYTRSYFVDNREYDKANSDRFTVDGDAIFMNDVIYMANYHVNMAAHMTLAKWFDYLRENGVYDNTRIIVVSDHGNLVRHKESHKEYMNKEDICLEHYCPLLMVKDFGATGFNVSDEFMTNADVVMLATEGLIDNPKNPYTGKAISNDEKTAHDQYVLTSEDCSDFVPGKTQLDKGLWFSVRNDVWDIDNWSVVAKNAFLPQ